MVVSHGRQGGRDGGLQRLQIRADVKHCLHFSFVFSAPLLTCLKKPVFSKRDLLWWEVPVRLYWDLLTSGRYQPAHLKSEKIPALLFVGKGPEYRPFFYT
jgi:hypothetical protein